MAGLNNRLLGLYGALVGTQPAGTNNGQAASTAFVNSALPTHITLDHEGSTVTVGTKDVLGFDSGSNYRVYTYNLGHADGDAFTNSFSCEAGTYSFDFYIYQDGNRGKCDIAIDGVAIGTIDSYNAGGAAFAVQSISSVVLTSGYHRMTMTVNGKNAGSTSFYFACQKIIIHKASD